MKHKKHQLDKAEFNIGFKEALAGMKSSGKISADVFKHGTLRAVLYKPDKIDKQQAHSQDEAYIVASGKGFFYCDGKTVQFEKGDFLFVSAGTEHWFENFSDDFVTWALFYGPSGGEKV